MGSVNLLIFLFSLSLACYLTSARVAVSGKNAIHLFDAIEANFAPKAKSPGEFGILYMAEPIDGCKELTNKAEKVSNGRAPFVLIVGGGCSAEQKVNRAQKAGFKAAIIYANEDDSDVSAASTRSSAVINIPAVFVTRASGKILKKYCGLKNFGIWIIPDSEYSPWSIVAFCFVSLGVLSLGVVTFFYAWHARRFVGMSSHLVNAIPSLIFTTVLDDNNSTSRACAICLEDYSFGDKLRILPCFHQFHASCVDDWLTKWRSLCPVCKCDAKSESAHRPPPSESTPLFSVASSLLSSLRSTFSFFSTTRVPRRTNASVSFTVTVNNRQRLPPSQYITV